MQNLIHIKNDQSKEPKLSVYYGYFLKFGLSLNFGMSCVLAEIIIKNSYDLYAFCELKG